MGEILITGDTYLGSNKIKNLAEDGDLLSLFGDFLPIIKNSSLSITNLESPITDEEEGTIVKTGPLLKSSKKSLNILKKAGFNLVTLANNHIMDYGRQGLLNTFKECQKLSLDYVGAGDSINEAQKPYITKLDGKSIAIINIAENEFSTVGVNPFGANPIDYINNS